MKKVPSTVVKQRSRELTSVFEAFTPYSGMEGRVERIWITEIAPDGIHLVSSKFRRWTSFIPSTISAKNLICNGYLTIRPYFVAFWVKCIVHAFY